MDFKKEKFDHIISELEAELKTVAKSLRIAGLLLDRKGHASEARIVIKLKENGGSDRFIQELKELGWLPYRKLMKRNQPVMIMSRKVEGRNNNV